MKKYFLTCMVLIIAVAAAAQTLRVATFNIRYDNPGDGPNQWKNRKVALSQQILDEKPDIVGMQEALIGQLMWLDTALAAYSRVGVGRDDGAEAGEFSPVWFNRQRFDMLASGTFWLSPTPARPSKGWDAALNRVCSWVKLHEKATGRVVFALNTHFDHMGEEARLQSARLLADTIGSMAHDGELVVLTGDFNAGPGSKPIGLLAARLTDTRGAASVDGVMPQPATFNGWDAARYTDCIDFIFCNKNGKPLSWRVFNQPGVYLSDHYMVMATLGWSR